MQRLETRGWWLVSALVSGHVEGPDFPLTLWCSRISIAITGEVQWGNSGSKGLASNLQTVSPAFLASTLAIQIKIYILFSASFALHFVVLFGASWMQGWWRRRWELVQMASVQWGFDSLTSVFGIR